MDTQVTPPPAEDTELLTLDKSESDQIKVRERLYKEKEYIDIRVFNKGDRGNFIPTKKGVMLPKDKMKELIAALAKIKL